MYFNDYLEASGNGVLTRVDINVGRKSTPISKNHQLPTICVPDYIEFNINRGTFYIEFKK